MQFGFTPEEEAFRRELRAFLQQELPPDWQGESESEERDWEMTLQMRKKLAQRGWLTLAWPKEYGGMGASPTMQLIFSEEMAYHRTPGIDIFGVKMLAPTLLIHGSEEQKRRYLPPIARGDVQWCQGYSEPETGSDLASLQCRAVEDGDDFVISGTKTWTSNAHRADYIFVLARTDPDAPRHRGISFILADMNSPGVAVEPIMSMDNYPRFNMVTLDNVRVPKVNLVGEKNRGWYIAATLLDFERSGVEYSAEARRMLGELVAFARETNTDGRILAQDPLIRRRLAGVAIEAEASRMLAYRIAWMQGQGQVPNREASMNKVLGTELLQRVAATGMALLGLYGQLEPGSKYAPLRGRIERAFTHCVSLTLAAGTSEIQRNIIATRGLGLPRG